MKVWFGLALALFIALYLPCFSADFFSLDDKALLFIPQFSPPFNAQSLISLFRIGANIDFYPIRDLSYLVDSFFWGQAPLGFHLQQFFWIVLSYIVLFFLLLELGIEKRRAFLFASIWIFHPFHVETFVWNSARKDILAIFGILAATYFSFKYNRTHKSSNCIAAIFFFLFSILSKATFVLFPICFFAFPRVRKSRVQMYCVWVATTIGLLWALFQSWFYRVQNDMSIALSVRERTEASLAALGKMMAGLILSRYNNIENDNLGDWRVLNHPFVFVGIGVWCVFFCFFGYCILKKKNIFTPLSALALYIPISGLIFSSRNFYSVRFFEPLFLLMIIALATYLSKASIEKIVGFGGFILIACSYSTFSEARIWETSLSVRKKALESSPASLSSRTFYYGDLISLKGSEKALHEKEIIAAKKYLWENCDQRKTGEFYWNCNFFYRYEFEVSLRNRDFNYARELFVLIQKSMSEYGSNAKILGRLEYELRLASGTLDNSFLERWDANNVAFPNPEYRMLKFASLCLGRTDSIGAKAFHEKLIHEHLLRANDSADFFKLAEPKYWERIRACL